jgi:hypothetical protein
MAFLIPTNRIGSSGLAVVQGTQRAAVAPRRQSVERKTAQRIAFGIGTKSEVASGGVRAAGLGGILKKVGAAIGKATLTVLGGGGQEPTGRPPGGTFPGGEQLVGCPQGFRMDANGQCVEVGFRGTLERALPFGQTGTLADDMGMAVVGGFGLPAMVPTQVGTIQRNNGSVAPILRCGRRMVLGADNLCYPKALLSRRSRFRKWKLPVRPAVSGADVAAIRRAEATRDRVKDLALSVGLRMTPKASTGKRRKKK